MLIGAKATKRPVLRRDEEEPRETIGTHGSLRKTVFCPGAR